MITVIFFRRLHMERMVWSVWIDNSLKIYLRTFLYLFRFKKVTLGLLDLTPSN